MNVQNIVLVIIRNILQELMILINYSLSKKAKSQISFKTQVCRLFFFSCQVNHERTVMMGTT